MSRDPRLYLIAAMAVIFLYSVLYVAGLAQ